MKRDLADDVLNIFRTVDPYLNTEHIEYVDRRGPSNQENYRLEFNAKLSPIFYIEEDRGPFKAIFLGTCKSLSTVIENGEIVNGYINFREVLSTEKIEKNNELKKPKAWHEEKQYTCRVFEPDSPIKYPNVTTEPDKMEKHFFDLGIKKLNVINKRIPDQKVNELTRNINSYNRNTRKINHEKLGLDSPLLTILMR